jgi:RNA polymerase sigma-70 factor (ECF subfamily)
MRTMETSGDLVRQLLHHRRVLQAYLYAIVRDPHLTEDLFQEVSVILLQKSPGLGEVRDFWALAREVARREALAALRKRGRGHTSLSPEALDAVDRGFEEISSQAADRRESLARCITKLPRLWRRIVELRYWMNLPVSHVASRLSKTENTVSVTLNRIRLQLAECVRQRLRAFEHDSPGA